MIVPADAEGRPDAVRRQLRGEIDQSLRVRDRTVAYPEHDLDQQRIAQHAIRLQRLGELQVATIEQLQLGQEPAA